MPVRRCTSVKLSNGIINAFQRGQGQSNQADGIYRVEPTSWRRGKRSAAPTEATLPDPRPRSAAPKFNHRLRHVRSSMMNQIHSASPLPTRNANARHHM